MTVACNIKLSYDLDNTLSLKECEFGMKLFVLGAGYVGKALLSRLKDQGHILYASTTQEEKVESLRFYTPHVWILKGDEKTKLQEILDLCDGMVILIAPKNRDDYEETYLRTAKTVLSVLKTKKKPFYLLYTSSTGVYENLQSEWVTEEQIVQPKSEKARILLETEKIYLECSTDNVTTCILRLGGIYGPDRELLRRAKHLSGKKMLETGDEPTNHIHLEDIVSAIVFCQNHRLSGIYNLVNDDHPTRRTLYNALCKSAHMEPPEWNSVPKDSRLSYKVSNDKIHQAGFIFLRPTLIS